MDYNEMLKRAMEMKPEKIVENSRFEIPEPDITVIGSRTTIRNFAEICKAIHRDPEHMAKFLSREFAAPASTAEGKLEVNSKILPATVRRKLEEYYKQYLFCPQCGKPDTKLIKEGKVMFLKCEACGAKKSVKVLK